MRQNGLCLGYRTVLPLAVLLHACTSYRTTTSRMETTAGADIGVPVAERFGVQPIEMRFHDSTFLELDVADTILDRRSADDLAELTLGIARLLQERRWEGQVVDSVRVTLIARDTTGGRDRTHSREFTYPAKLLRQATDTP